MMNRSENSLTDVQVRDILHHELSKSLGNGPIENDLRDWDKKEKAEKTLMSLLQVYRDWLNLKQIRKNNIESLRDNGNGLLRRHKKDRYQGADQSLPHQERKGKGDNKGGGKGKEKGKGKSDKGKGKGKDTTGQGKGKGKGKTDGGDATPATPPPPSRPDASRRASSANRDANGKPKPILDDKGRRINLCFWFQTKWNGAHTCPLSQKECAFLHEHAKNRAEFDAIRKPRADAPAPKPQKGKGKGKGKDERPTREDSPGPKAKAKVKAKANAKV